MTTRVFIRIGLMAAVILVAGLLLPPVAQADASDDLQKEVAQVEDQLTEVKARALSILRQVRAINSDCRAENEQVILVRQVEAQQRLVRVQRQMEPFVDVAQQVRGDAAKLKKKLPYDDPYVTQRVEKVINDSNRLLRRTREYFDQAVSTFGLPLIVSESGLSLGRGQKLAITGQASGGLGFSQHKYPNTSPGQKASAADINFGVKGSLVPAAQTEVLFHLSHETTVQRRKVGITKFGLSGVQNLGRTASVTGGFNLMHYSDKHEVLRSYQDFGLFAKGVVQLTGVRLDGKVETIGHNFTNIDKFGYRTTTLQGGAQAPLGNGKVKARLRLLTRSWEIKALNHKEFNPTLVWQFNRGGSEVGASYQSITHPELDDSPLDNKRYKLHLKIESRQGQTKRQFIPEVMIYRYAHAKQNNFTDFKLNRNRISRDDAFKTLTWTAVYRLYPDDSHYDFAQLTRRYNRQPLGSGGYFRFNMAMKFYTESSDNSDSLRFGNVHPPHMADLFLAFGSVKAGRGWLQRMAIGPTFGATFLLDSERDGAFSADFNDVDYLWRNPGNSARVGVEASFAGVTVSGVTWKADIAYQLSFKYNADPKRSSNILDIRTQLNYPLTDEWVLDAYTDLHRTRASIKSASDLDRTKIGLQVRYRFDVRR